MGGVVSQGFQGSDTDELDRIVAKMREAAQYAENIARALQILCKALDAMSWTGYAAALAAYLRGVVIPLLKNVAAELKAFAAIVSLASTIQKDASSDRWIVDTGDVGYTPQQLPTGSSDVPAPDREEVSVADAPTIGAVDGVTAPNRQQVSTSATGSAGSVDQVGRDERLSRVAQDIATLIGHIQQLRSATSDAGETTEAITALGSVVTDIGHLVSDVDGTGSSLGSSGGEGTIEGGSAGSGSGIDYSSDQGLQQIWHSVNGVLRTLGLLPTEAPDPTVPDGAVGSDGTVATGDGGMPSGTVTVDRGVISGDLDAISADLDRLRADLGLDASGGSLEVPAVQYDAGTGDDYLSTPASGALAPSALDTTPAGDGGAYATDGPSGLGGAGSGASGGTGAALPGSGGGSGAGQGSGSGGGSLGSGGASGGGSGTAPPADAASEAPSTRPAYPADTRVPVTASGAVPGTVVTDGPQTRLVATTVDTGTSSAAIPISGGAVAASLLGGLFARKARQAAGPDGSEASDGTDSAAADLAGPIYQP